MQTMQAGWLADITNWLLQQIKDVWAAFIAFMRDMVVSAIEGVTDFFATAVESIPVPDFVQSYSMNGLLANAGPEIAWVVGTFRIGEGLGIIALGYGFRLLRKLLTLGQW